MATNSQADSPTHFGGTTPDAELLRAAREGELQTPAQLWQQAERLLDQTELRERTTTRFIKDWARLESLPDEDGLKADLTTSAVAFYNGELGDPSRPLASLWTAPTAYLTPDLAERDGLASQGNGARSYPGTARVGILSQPGVIAGMTNADGGEIVARGLFLLSQVFCEDVRDPPDELQNAIDAFVDEIPAGTSARAIAEARLERQDCAFCHQDFDPLGYGFEQFDFRGSERNADEFGNSVRQDGWIPARFASGSLRPYNNVAELTTFISESEQVTDCLLRKNIEFLIGRLLEGSQEAAVGEIRHAYQQYGGTYRAMIRAIVEHPIFWRIQRSES